MGDIAFAFIMGVMAGLWLAAILVSIGTMRYKNRYPNAQ